MALKILQACDAGMRLMRDPLHVPTVARFLDAVMDTDLMRALYAQMLGALDPEELLHLRDLTYQPLDIPSMGRLPKNTFGHQVYAFSQRNGYDKTTVEAQIEAYPPIARLLEKDWVFRRFVKVHDLEHVLTDFLTDPPAEMGLQVFNYRNYREPFGLSALAFMPVSFLRYGRVADTVAEATRGWWLGKHALNVFSAPLEDWLADDLDEVRERLNLDVEEAGYYGIRRASRLARAEGG
jgi:ubiquinone biosynthesis protein Coq4